MNAVKSYFKLVLNKETVFDKVIRPKNVKHLPEVFSKEKSLKGVRLNTHHATLMGN